MKKIKITSLILVVSLLLSSCEDDSIKIPQIEDFKYNIKTNANGAPALHVKLKNSSGQLTITLPGSDTPITIKNEEVGSILNSYLSTNKEIKSFISSLNYINFRSDESLIISYNNDKNVEMVIPDMLTEDGLLKGNLKYRRDFLAIFVRWSEEFSRFLDIPSFGELPPAYKIYHKSDVDGMNMIYLNYTGLINIVPAFGPKFGLDENMMAIVNSILAQYNKTDDEMEIGIYLKKID